MGVGHKIQNTQDQIEPWRDFLYPTYSEFIQLLSFFLDSVKHSGGCNLTKNNINTTTIQILLVIQGFRIHSVLFFIEGFSRPVWAMPFMNIHT